MQADYLWRFSLIEMAIHSVAHLLTKGIQGVRLGKDRLPQSSRGKTAFCCFLDQENDFVHAVAKSAFRLRRLSAIRLSLARILSAVDDPYVFFLTFSQP
jgi:hypothetical protein